jgi:hypothetical protein
MNPFFASATDGGGGGGGGAGAPGGLGLGLPWAAMSSATEGWIVDLGLGSRRRLINDDCAFPLPLVFSLLKYVYVHITSILYSLTNC